MKLGLCYMVFDGEELLRFAIEAVRNYVDFISCTYQSVSYFGNPASPELLKTLTHLKNDNLVDELVYYETDLSIHHKQNELNLRNLGLQTSKKANCTHHISADADDFYVGTQLDYVKQEMAKEDYDFAMVHQELYYKEPTQLITPSQGHMATLIHPVRNEYAIDKNFPFCIETTRRLKTYNKYRVFSKDEFVLHHMSFVRKDIRKKYQNSDTGLCAALNMKKFMATYENYKVGQIICVPPDFMNRRTKLVDNIFGIMLN